MRLLKSNVLLRLLNSYLVDSPQPANISYLWNFGSLLGFCLILQILTGVFLAMHYTPNVDMAFSSVEHIMRDVSAGWALRYTHGAPCDGLFEPTNIVKKFICLLSIILFGLINQLGSEQSIKKQNKAVGPDCILLEGVLYGQVYELETFSWAKYILVILSRICRSLFILYRKVHVTFENLNRINDVHI